ncbi:MAG TPA: tetratricopeptide repeat protein [Bryobacteraceae bacterium]|nr:tetratricopeptide repeat protein [Bryobacteraceae bacterium]
MMRAISLLAAALALAPGASAQLNDGIAAFNHGDYNRARQYLTNAGNDPRARVYLALTDAAAGQCGPALPALETAFAAKSDSRLLRLTGLALAGCRILGKQFAEAEPVMNRLAAEFPSDADVLYLAAELHMKAWNDAIYRMYRNAPASYRVNELSAEVFETQSKYAEAVAEYRKAIAKNPRAIDLHYRLGRALLLQSHDPAALEAARKEFEAELQLNPSDAAAEYQVAQILQIRGDRAAAAPHFERAIELRPDFTEALVAMAKIRMEEKRYAVAVPLLERAIRIEPRSEVAHYNLMMAYRNAGRAADAQREKAELDKLQRPPEGEFTDFLKRLGEKAPSQ